MKDLSKYFLLITLLHFTFSTEAQIKTIYKGHKAEIIKIAFSPDGRYFFSGSKDKTIKTWDINKNKTIRSIKIPFSYATPLDISTDGKFALTASKLTIDYWDLTSGQKIHTFKQKHKNTILSVALSPDKKYALSGGIDNSLILWDIDKEKAIRSTKYEKVNAIAFGPKGDFALTSGASVNLWSLSKSKKIMSFKTLPVKTIAYSSDGKYALSNKGNAISLWNISTGKKLKTFDGHTKNVNTIAFSPDNKYIISGSGDLTLNLWEINTGKKIKTFGYHPHEIKFSIDCTNECKGHNASITAVAFSPNGQYIISGGKDKNIIIWDSFESIVSNKTTIEKTGL